MADAGRKRIRLDVALVERGLESSRERARRLVVAGEVRVDGQVARAPSTLIDPGAALAVGKTLPYVGRGGLKLAHALDRFGVDPAGQVCLDAGASTGGFSDVLLQRGARRVYAVDVGRGLLAWPLRQDPRVVVMEEANVRYLRLAGPSGPLGAATVTTSATEAGAPAGERAPAGSAGAPSLPEPVSLAVVDLAFISLRLVLPAIAGVLTPDGEVIALVKPQFEAGPADARKGIVRDPAVHRRVLVEVIGAVRAVGLHAAGLTASPVRGQAGNVEFLLWSRRKPAPAPFDDAAAIGAALAEVPAQKG